MPLWQGGGLVSLKITSPSLKPYYIYILACCDKTLYIGITTDISRRTMEHNHSFKGAKYTQTRRPVHLVYYEKVESKSDALKKEYQLKKLSRQKKLQKIYSLENCLCGDI